MANGDERVPLDVCTLPGTIKVTRSALALAETFHGRIPAGWIVAFSWHDGARVRANKDAPWIDKGPGMGLGAYEMDDLREEVIHQSGPFRYAVLIPRKIIDTYPEKTIDLNESGNPTLR